MSDVNVMAMTLTQLESLRADIAGELARRSSGKIDLSDGRKAPRGGAILYDRPAIGGDRNRDVWYPSLEAANAALLEMADGLETSKRKDGGLRLNYTARGCSDSEAYVVAS